MKKTRKKFYRVFEIVGEAMSVELVDNSKRNWYSDEETAAWAIDNYWGLEDITKDFIVLPVYSFDAE